MNCRAVSVYSILRESRPGRTTIFASQIALHEVSLGLQAYEVFLCSWLKLVMTLTLQTGVAFNLVLRVELIYLNSGSDVVKIFSVKFIRVDPLVTIG